jgi:hypothetical protein
MQWLRMIPSEEARQTKRGVRRYFELQGAPIELPDDGNEGEEDEEDLEEDEEEEEDDDLARYVGDEDYQQMFPDTY